MDSKHAALPNPKFDNVPGANTTPAQFHQYLRSLIEQSFNSNPPNRIHAADGKWDTLILGLSDTFCGSFPLPGSISWNATREKITILETVLEFIYRAALHVDGLLSGKRDAVNTVVVRLLNICNVLDVWLDGQVEVEDGLPSPTTLREQAFKALVAFLRSLGGSITRPAQQEEPRWKVLRILLAECTELVFGVFVNFE
jgi:serine/threonine-protein kinase ATR